MSTVWLDLSIGCPDFDGSCSRFAILLLNFDGSLSADAGPMNSNDDSAQKKLQPPKSGKELKVLLSKRPEESWEEFKARAIEEFDRAGLLGKEEE